MFRATCVKAVEDDRLHRPIYPWGPSTLNCGPPRVRPLIHERAPGRLPTEETGIQIALICTSQTIATTRRDWRQIESSLLSALSSGSLDFLR